VLPALPPPLQDGELTDKNCSVAVVGRDMPFTLLEDEALQPYIEGGWRLEPAHAQGQAALWGETRLRWQRGDGLCCRNGIWDDAVQC
jgi:hypothetical protein